MEAEANTESKKENQLNSIKIRMRLVMLIGLIVILCLLSYLFANEKKDSVLPRDNAINKALFPN